jgi:hypothetical protein
MARGVLTASFPGTIPRAEGFVEGLTSPRSAWTGSLKDAPMCPQAKVQPSLPSRTECQDKTCFGFTTIAASQYGVFEWN